MGGQFAFSRPGELGRPGLDRYSAYSPARVGDRKMRRRITQIVVFCIMGAMLLNGCRGTPTPTNEDSASGLNLLVVVEGNVQLKRENWKEYIPVGFGTMLYPTDLLKVEGSTSVLCADLSVRSLDPLGNLPCPTDGGWLEYHGFRFDSQQRSISQEVPYILYPRNTLVLDERPLLQWHDTGASSYTVLIEKDGQVVWSQEGVVSDTLRYPDDAPSLTPGSDYLLVVRDNITGRMSTEDPAKGLGFQLLDDTNRQAIAQRHTEILGLASLDVSAKKMALAVYYLGLKVDGIRGLWGEAWRLLEDVAKTRDAPAVYLRLGDALAAMKLPNEAEAVYQTALQNAKTMGDKETQAAAYVGLWRITGDKQYINQAVDLYELIGDDISSENLRQERASP